MNHLVARIIAGAGGMTRRVAELTAHAGLLQQALDQLTTAVVLADSAGRVLVVNRTAAIIIDQWLDLSQGKTDPATSVSKRAAAVRAWVERMGARDAKRPRVLRLQRHGTRRPVTVLAVTLSTRNEPLVASIEPTEMMALFLDDPEHPVALNLLMLQRTYQLTKGELRVAQLLANGQDLQKISRVLQITMNTARTHLKRLLSKTGTHRQSDLIWMLLTTSVSTVLRAAPGPERLPHSGDDGLLEGE